MSDPRVEAVAEAQNSFYERRALGEGKTARSWALIPVTPGVASWEAFLAAKRITEWSRDTAPKVLGARPKEPVWAS